tara:strand:- start:33 stop:218 length:186 start_codon:yes stop_codon:yes gene_type:complete
MENEKTKQPLLIIKFDSMNPTEKEKEELAERLCNTFGKDNVVIIFGECEIFALKDYYEKLT